MPEFAHILKSAFDPFFQAPITDWQEFANLCTEQYVKKDEVLKQANKTEKHFNFIIEGSLGIFLWKEHNWVCLDFGFDHHFFGDYMSILTGAPTPLQTIALEDSRLLQMKRDDYIMLGQTEMGKVITKIAAEASFLSKQQQQIDLLTKTAEERYLEILAHQPEIVQRVAQKHLASYLGITPQSFSRIRKKIK